MFSSCFFSFENSSNIEFKKDVEREFGNVECILTGENFGYGKANNIGLKKVKTKSLKTLNTYNNNQEDRINLKFIIVNKI